LTRPADYIAHSLRPSLLRSKQSERGGQSESTRHEPVRAWQKESPSPWMSSHTASGGHGAVALHGPDGPQIASPVVGEVPHV
jgi:hypothetical protein